MMTPENGLAKMELIQQYVENEQKKAKLTKEYEQQINEARTRGKNMASHLSAAEITQEVTRVVELMAKKLAEKYQTEYNETDKQFREEIANATALVTKGEATIAKCEKEIPLLESRVAQYNRILTHCKKYLSERDFEIEREYKFDYSFNEHITKHLTQIKEHVQKIPEEYLRVRIGNESVSKAAFLNYEPPRFTGDIIQYKFLDIKVEIPTSLKGKLFKTRNNETIEQLPHSAGTYNHMLTHSYACDLYRFLLKNYSDIASVKKRLDEYKRELIVSRGNLPSDETMLSELKKAHAELRSLTTFRQCIEALFINPLSKNEVEQVKAQVLKTAASPLPIQPDDLIDYFALCNRNEDFKKFKMRCIQEQAKKYIDGINRNQAHIEALQAELQKKLAALQMPDLVSVFREWSNKSPLYAQMGFPPQLLRTETESILQTIIQEAANQYSLRVYPNGGIIYCTDEKGNKFKTTNGDYVYAPSYSFPFGRGKSIANLVIAHDRQGETDAQKALNRTLLNILLALPPRKVKLRIIDLAATNMASLFTTRLHPSLYHDEVVMNERELRGVVEEWQSRTKRVMQKCEYIFDYNDEHQTWLEPYEIAVVLGYPRSLSPGSEELLRPFVQNGYKSGIIFVFVNNLDTPPAHGQKLLEDKERFKFITPYYKLGNLFPLPYTPIADHPQLLEAALAYLNAEAGKKEEKPVAKQDADSLISTAYQPDTAARVDVAVGDDNGRTVHFELDTVSHLHAFILGQSGTGKSRFLHNIIGNIMLAHSPRNVEFYLLDLKLGGVEFNAYRGEKHVRALLVDNNDRQITLEILRDLGARMEQRNKQFAELGVRNLEAYNQKADTPMPQLVLVVDECQMLFNERPDNTERELRGILSLIAKQGRSQGVHMILATQTLMNSTIPIDELQGAGLTDFYLLNCDPRDSEKLVKDSSPITGTLQTGEIFYHHHQHAAPDVQFRAFYVDDAQQERILAGVNQKCAQLPAVPQFYFSGKQQAVLSAETLSSLQRKSRRTLCASLGMGIDLKQQPINISLSEEQGENVLLFGLNQHQQATRTATEIFLSSLYSARAAGRDTEFVVLDCLSSDEETPYQQLFDTLEDEGAIRQLFGRQRGEWLARLGDAVRDGKANETVILVLGQERWREVRNDRELEIKPAANPAQTPGGSMPSFLGGGAFGGGRTTQRTYRNELQYLLEYGSEQGVHFILQVDKPQNLIGGQNLSQQMIKKLFRHWVMLRSAAESALLLRLRDDIRLETLSDDLDRLRAIYYSDDTDTYQLITPYRYTTIEENKQLISF